MSMKRLPLRSLHRECTLLAVLCLGVLAGCGRENIRVYSVPKERPTLAEGEPGGQPHIRWKLPAGWEEREGDQMRLARFAVAGKEGDSADVSIIPLGGISAGKDQLLNLWREQIHLPPAEPEQLANSATAVAIGSSNGEL